MQNRVIVVAAAGSSKALQCVAERVRRHEGSPPQVSSCWPMLDEDLHSRNRIASTSLEDAVLEKDRRRSKNTTATNQGASVLANIRKMKGAVA